MYARKIIATAVIGSFFGCQPALATGTKPETKTPSMHQGQGQNQHQTQAQKNQQLVRQSQNTVTNAMAGASSGSGSSVTDNSSSSQRYISIGAASPAVAAECIKNASIFFGAFVVPLDNTKCFKGQLAAAYREIGKFEKAEAVLDSIAENLKINLGGIGESSLITDTEVEQYERYSIGEVPLPDPL